VLEDAIFAFVAILVADEVERVVQRGNRPSTLLSASRRLMRSPSISLRATVQKAELNGKPVPFRIEANGQDQHVVVRFSVKSGKYFLRIRILHDFGVSVPSSLPLLGGVSRGLRILSESWSPSRDQLTLEVSGAAGEEYCVQAWNLGETQVWMQGVSTRKLRIVRLELRFRRAIWKSIRT